MAKSNFTDSKSIICVSWNNVEILSLLYFNTAYKIQETNVCHNPN
jgi:hypothetical protein